MCVLELFSNSSHDCLDLEIPKGALEIHVILKLVLPFMQKKSHRDLSGSYVVFVGSGVLFVCGLISLFI